MRCKFVKRILVLALAVCLLLTSIPFSPFVTDVEAVSGVNSLTCAGFISNTKARNYIDTMMRYYINSSTTLQNTLNNGNSVVFMFEGGSDNYWSGGTYSDSDYNVRLQATCIVVKMNSSGNAYIAFYSENCSSIPGEPTDCTNGVAYSGSTTLMDGTYSFFTHNHTGPYAAFQVDLTSSSGYCYYTPTANMNGYKAGASGINIHTRSTNVAGGSSLGWAWSEGCQLIGYGGDSGNSFNSFVKAITGITWNPWISWSSKNLNTWTYSQLGIYKGYYVLDRQLALTNPSGTEYGSGSLATLYNKTALTNITAKSTAARKAAGVDKVDYLSQCTYYPAYGKIVCTGTDVWTRTLPCYSSVDSSTVAIAEYNSGDVLTCTALFKNTVGEYWYRTLSSSGTVGYVRAAYMEFKEQIVTDVTISGHTAPNGHVKGKSFAIDGTVKTTYNQLTAVSAYVHSGFGTTGTQQTGTRVTVSSNSYSLDGSTVDNNVLMGNLATGNYTLAIAAEYKNYYVTNDTTLNTNTGKIYVTQDYFMVIPSSVSQSSCSHTYKTYVLKASTCTTNGSSIQACTTCGLVGKATTTTGAHSYGSWVTVDATCTTAGSKTRTCTACGNKETQTIPVIEHNYTSQTFAPTCIEYERTVYTCTNCGDTYTESLGEPTPWQETKPEGVDESLIETKTQYRYSDYKTITSPEPIVDGYTLINSAWETDSTGTVYYVPSWPSGFDKTSTIYNEYNGTKKTASQNYYTKTEINSDARVGYLYYHWCKSGSIYSYAAKQDDYTTFHAYYATGNPSNYTCDTSDMSYKTSNTACCTDSEWYFVTDVYAQKYTNYNAVYTHSIWTDYSEWSDTEVTAAWNKKVETRTMYRLSRSGELAEHNYVNGTCSVCGKAKPDYYLFGFINGADYGGGADSENIGTYKFVDGRLSATFTEDSYVAVKTSDNEDWYMADGYPGDDATSAVLYNTDVGITAEKLFVPKGRQANFILTENSDGTLTLSYTLGACHHDSHNTDGSCTVCGDTVYHTYADGVCTVCGKAEPDYYLVGFINGADYGSGADSENIGSYKFVDGKLIVTFTEDSYVALKTGDNTAWYSTDGYKGEGTTSAVFYNTELLGDNADKMFVPKGREITFTLVNNGDDTFTLSYNAAQCEHKDHDTSGICTTCGDEVGHTNVDGVCTICGYNCDHNYVDGTCTVCGKAEPVYYLQGFIDGADHYGTDYEFVDGTLTATFTDYSYVVVGSSDNITYVTDGYQAEGVTSAVLYDSTVIGDGGDKLYIPKGREITFTLTDNGDGTLTLSYVAEECEHADHNLSGICTSCGEDVGHTSVDGICTICGHNCNHSFVDGVCTICGVNQPVYYLVGFISGADNYGTEYKFTDGTLTAKFTEDSYVLVRDNEGNDFMTDGFKDGATSVILYNSTDLGESADKLLIPKGRYATFTLTDNGDGTFTLSFVLSDCEHDYHDTSGICTVCGETVEHTYENGSCTVCGLVCEHMWADGKCSVCGQPEPDYYLFGIINGAEYASGEDFENMGIYRFNGGKLVAVFTQDSFVAVKTEDNTGWYMTSGYQGDDATSAVLYNTAAGIEDAQRLFVPKGRLITFTLTYNGDDTYILSYEAAPCYHVTHDTTGACTTCGDAVEHTYKNGACTICGAACNHYWFDGQCAVCGAVCEHIWIDGNCVACGTVCEHSFKDGICGTCGTVCEHSFTDGICGTCGTVCEHSWSGGTCILCGDACEHSFTDGICDTCGTVCMHRFTDGVCTACGAVCEHSFTEGRCDICGTRCKHSFTDGICTTCGIVCKHTWTDGKCAVCGETCEHSFTDGVCDSCGTVCGHSFTDSVCDTCGVECKHIWSDETCTICGRETQFWLVGYINGTSVGCDEDYNNTGNYKFENGSVSVYLASGSYIAVKTTDNSDWYMTEGNVVGTNLTLYNTKTGEATDMLYIPGGVNVTFTLTDGENGTMDLSYEITRCRHFTHRTNGNCSVCGELVEHTYTNGICDICGKTEPVYYLFGIINGAEYGSENDSDAIGAYKFTGGTLVATFTEDSYVAVKTGDNLNWFMTDGPTGTDTTSVTLYNTANYSVDADRMYVPGGVELTFTLTVNGDDTLTLSYTQAEIPEPSLQINPKYTSMSYEEEIVYNVYYTVDNLGSVALEDMGLITFADNDANGTVENAIDTVSGAVYSGNYLMVHTNAVHPKNMGDTVYFKIYAKLADGSFVYSDIMNYSAVRYANSILNNRNSTDEQKALMVALLNFGAEAQKYYGYNTDSLVNASLTASQQALVSDYSADMAVSVSAADSTKLGEFAKTGNNTMLYPTVSFDDTLFTINYNCKIKGTADGDITLYFWDAEAYESNAVLTADNATGSITMEASDGGFYTASVNGIAAKDIDETVYVSVVYTSGGTEYCSGVMAYSMAEYCKVYAGKNSSDIQALAQATVVYGYYAKNYLAD